MKMEKAEKSEKQVKQVKVKGPKKLLKVKTGPTVQETPTSRSRRSARGVPARPDLLLC